VPAPDAARVRDACARWSGLWIAVGATSYHRPDTWCSSGREHVHHGACHCKGSSTTTPGWEYQLAAVTRHLRTAWTSVIDVRRTTPATRTAQTVAQVKSVLRHLPVGGAVPLFVFDAGYSAAALTDGPVGCPAHVLDRLPAGSAFYQDASSGPARTAGQRAAARKSTAWSRRPSQRQPAGMAAGGRKKPLPPALQPGEELTGTVRAEAWREVHPQVHGDRGWFAAGRSSPSCAAPCSTSRSSVCPTTAPQAGITTGPSAIPCRGGEGLPVVVGH
jgi:hypothetical protein